MTRWKILIIGAGLLGVSSAYFLRRRGHEVTVIEREAGPGLGASFANGSLLTPSMAEPWNAPGCGRVLLQSLMRSDSALKLRVRSIPSLAGWGIQFLRHSKSALFEAATRHNLRLALYSGETLARLRAETAISYGRSARGALKVFRGRTEFDIASRASEPLNRQGLRVERLSPRETVRLEPALLPIVGALAGALYYEGDEIGDAFQFCGALTEIARKRGVDFQFGTEVLRMEVRSGLVKAITTTRGAMTADRYVVAAGSYSAGILKSAQLDLLVRPAKGYSVTFEDSKARPSLRIPVIDDHWHAAVVPLDGAIRVAGTAEFAGFNRTLDPKRIRSLGRLLREVLPEARLDAVSAKPWCGLRPMSADGVPFIGQTTLANLFVNTGHGHLGWTMAAGSGELLANLISGDSTGADPTPYSPGRVRL